MGQRLRVNRYTDLALLRKNLIIIHQRYFFLTHLLPLVQRNIPQPPKISPRRRLPRLRNPPNIRHLRRASLFLLQHDDALLLQHNRHPGVSTRRGRAVRIHPRRVGALRKGPVERAWLDSSGLLAERK
jgi:hypothetical protein